MSIASINIRDIVQRPSFTILFMGSSSSLFFCIDHIVLKEKENLMAHEFDSTRSSDKLAF